MCFFCWLALLWDMALAHRVAFSNTGLCSVAKRTG